MIAVILLIYLLVLMSVRALEPHLFAPLFALVNLSCFSFFQAYFSLPDDRQVDTFHGFRSVFPRPFFVALAVGVTLIGMGFVLVRLSHRNGYFFWLAILAPLFALVAFRHVGWVVWGAGFALLRLSLLPLELRQGRVERVHFIEFAAFVTFPLILFSGPFYLYSQLARDLREPYQFHHSRLRSWAPRFIVGLCKVFVASAIIYPFIPSQFIGAWPELHFYGEYFLSFAAFYIFLFFCFSGVSDLAIGASGLIGLRLPENFNDPLLSKNLQDHWNRWHISFLEILRELVFWPVATSIARYSKSRHLGTVVGILAVFALIGLWSGGLLPHFMFASMHAAGLIVVMFFGEWKLKQTWIAPSVFTTLGYRLAAWALTFAFISMSYFFYTQSLRYQMFYYRSVFGG